MELNNKINLYQIYTNNSIDLLPFNEIEPKWGILEGLVKDNICGASELSEEVSEEVAPEETE